MEVVPAADSFPYAVHAISNTLNATADGVACARHIALNLLAEPIVAHCCSCAAR